jgi:hypothetical protein
MAKVGSGYFAAVIGVLLLVAFASNLVEREELVWPFRKRAPTQTQGRSSSPIQVMTVLSPQQQTELGGLPGPAIAGTLDKALKSGERVSPASFHLNPAFVDFMQHVIRTFGPEDPELQESARRQGNGSITIIDQRIPPGGGNRKIPLEDIVGIFAVENGRLGNYHPNDKHQLFTEHGLVRLPPSLYKLHIRELMRLKVAPL